MMNSGKTRRLRRIMQQDNHTVIVPMDHGVTVGPIQGITNMQQITDQLVKGKADAILVHKGHGDHFPLAPPAAAGVIIG